MYMYVCIEIFLYLFRKFEFFLFGFFSLILSFLTFTFSLFVFWDVTVKW